MGDSRKSLIFEDFGGFREIHWAEHDGRSCQTGTASFPSETNVSEVFQNVWIKFSGFLKFGAWFSTLEILEVT